MDETRLQLHTAFEIGEVDPRIFGGFLEHMGRSIYEGVYEPSSPHADEHGFRTDVLDALDRLRLPVVRYPGGNFASGYHWLDGVGPKEDRPTVRELAWQSIEPNEVGTDEFMTLCRRLQWDPMLAVNLGTGTPEEARNWVEYCNAPVGTRFADLRAENGNPEPHDVRLWCLGNEMDGPWQLGHVPAREYAIRAQQAAKMMKDVDRRIELVVSGTCVVELPTYLDWDREVLEYIGGLADYISLHRYVGDTTGDTADFLAVTNAIDRQIDDMDATCRFVQGKRRSHKRAFLCFDEWNVWYKNRDFAADMNGAGRFAPPLVEERYDLQDALVVAGFFNSFLRRADVVRIANIAQLVNVIAPIQTRGDELLIQSIFHVFELYSKRRSGRSLRCVVTGPQYTSDSYGTVHLVDSAAIVDGSTLSVFLTNRSLDEEATVRVSVADAAVAEVRSAEIVTGAGAHVQNSYEQPDLVVAAPFDGAECRDGDVVVVLPPLSVTALTVGLNR